MNVLKIFILLSLVVFARSVGAHAVALRCDACGTATTMEGVALQAGAGDRYVFSLPQATIRRFWVERICPGTPPRNPDERGQDSETAIGCPAGWQYFAFQTAVDTDVQHFFGEVVDTWHAYGQSLHGFEIVDFETAVRPHLRTAAAGLSNWPDDVNAYDVVNDSSVRNSIITAYNNVLDQQRNPRTIGNILRGGLNFQAGYVSFTVLRDQASFRVQVRFRDGSSVVLRMVNPGAVEYAPGTAVDANQATIPDYSHNPNLPGGNPGPLTGEHSPSDIGRWIDTAILNGINVERIGGSRIRCGSVLGGPWQCMTI